MIFFEIRSVFGTTDHPQWLFKSRCTNNIRRICFAEYVINNGTACHRL